MQKTQPRIAPQYEVQSLIQTLNSGRFAQAETDARRMLQQYPATSILYNVLGVALENQQKFAAAEQVYRQAIQLDNRIAEIHFNLGVVLGHQGKNDEAIASYRKAIAIQPDARGHFNLGTALRNEGLLDDAIKSFEQALAIDPNYAEAHSNLGESLWYRGKLNEAVAHFSQALAIDPENPSANYNLAVFLYDNNELERAIPHFERSRFDDWHERTLYCLYKTERYDEFRARLQDAIIANSSSPLLATLSTHHAINFGGEDTYNFCNNPLDFVYHGRIDALAEPDSPLLKQLLHDIDEVETTGRVQSRMQSRLHHGVQSSGNLFKRPEASFRKLAELIADTVRRYYQTYKHENCAFIREFPENIEFSSSWYVRMRTGGHLDSHIHEEGWISGAVYLAMPENLTSEEEGCIELSTHGDNYPQKHHDFPTRLVRPQIGDVCFFPSSVFHRTIPFNADQERICVAFDVKPKKDHGKPVPAA